MYKIEVKYSGALPGSENFSSGSISSYIYNQLNNLNNVLSGLQEELDLKTSQLHSYFTSGIENAFNSSIDYYSNVITNSEIYFKTGLVSGLDSFSVLFPSGLMESPDIINVLLENPVDEIVYATKVSQISESGFLLELSDNLNSNDYLLSVYAHINPSKIINKINQNDDSY